MATAPRLAALAAKSMGMYGPSSRPGFRVAEPELVAEGGGAGARCKPWMIWKPWLLTTTIISFIPSSMAVTISLFIKR